MADEIRYNVYAPNGGLLFTATAEHVAHILRLYPTALDRVIREVAQRGSCVLHHNGRRTPWDGQDYHTVEAAE